MGIQGPGALRAPCRDDDARAHGQSDGGRDYSYQRLADDLLTVLDDRGIPKATLAGASMGAHTITKFALDHPDRVSGLVLMTPAFAPTATPAWNAGTASRTASRTAASKAS